MQPKIPTIKIPDMKAILTAPRRRLEPKPVSEPKAEPEPTEPLDPEQESKRELNELQSGFIARAKAEEARRTLVTDSEFWVCLCFQTREQVEAFMRETGWGAETDKYVDGRRVARELEVSLPPDPQYPKSRCRATSWRRHGGAAPKRHTQHRNRSARGSW
jgi:hypothetical protein